MKKIYLYLLLLPLAVNGQRALSLQNAIDTALKNSFDIQIARNNLEIKKLNNTLGMAGGLPSLGISASDNFSLSNSFQKLNSGTETSLENITGNNINAGISANMYLFNGFKITATKQRLELLQKQGDLLLNSQIQHTATSVMIKYFDIIRQQQYLSIIQHSLDVANKKMEIVNERKKVGMASEVVALQAQIDVNNAEENLKLQQLAISQDKTELLGLMSVKTHYEFSISDSITIDKNLKLDSVLNGLKNNPQYISSENQVKISEQLYKETRAQRYPSVKINAAYNLIKTDNSKGTLLTNQNYGPFAGLTLLIPLYDGYTKRNQQKAANYEISNSKLEKQSLLNTLQIEAISTYQSYSTALQQVETQQKNFNLAKELVELVLKNYKVNQSTILDVKAAQTSFENAAYTLVNVKYSAKIAEIELKSLVYQLKY